MEIESRWRGLDDMVWVAWVWRNRLGSMGFSAWVGLGSVVLSTWVGRWRCGLVSVG
jgi:hypothetical protein